MKRFTDTDIWTKNLWFRKLSKENKLLWFFLKDNCDSVGVWEIDIEFAEMLTGCKYNLEQILTDFKKQVIAFKDNRKIWIKDFCNFQYGELNEDNIKNRPQQSYIALLKKHSLWIDYTKTIHSLKEKEQDKDIEKEKEKEKIGLVNDSKNEIEPELLKAIRQADKWRNEFDKARLLYKGTIRGTDIEYNDFGKKHKDYKKVIELLVPAIQYEIDWRSKAEKYNENKKDKDKIFIPNWKNFKTWLSQRCWEQVLPEIPSTKKSERKYFE